MGLITFLFVTGAAVGVVSYAIYSSHVSHKAMEDVDDYIRGLIEKDKAENKPDGGSE